jgi:two-component sensor histidine kinase
MTSIRQRLQRSLIVTIGVIVLLMTIAFFLVEVVSFRQLVIESVVPKAELVAIHLRRPLALRDSWSAQEILATLATDPSIEGAYLFNRQTQPFAYYQKNRSSDEIAPQKTTMPFTAKEDILPLLATKSQQTFFSWQHISVFVPIIHNNETIGTVYVVSTLAPFYLRLLWWLLAAIAATAIAIYAGLTIARKLQERITAPISDLAGMMHIVTRDGDLTQRAELRGQGEIATLADGFNQMLQAINHRDDELLTINFGLEERIAERTQALNASLHEKELLLREVHHRVKNNLQIISSLLSLQMKKIYDPLAKEALRTSLSRIRSISLIHEKLYLTGRQATGNDLGAYLRELAEEIFRLHSIDPGRIQLQLDLVSVETDFDRLIHLALIFNELLTNTFKHAFTPTESGVVTIRLRHRKQQVILTVQDNGKGLPDNFLLETTSTVGLQLTNNLVRQAKGQFNLLRNPPGTEAVVSYPLVTSS